MIKITTNWLKICGHSNEEIENLIIEDIKVEIFKHFDVKHADKIFLEMKVNQILNFKFKKK